MSSRDLVPFGDGLRRLLLPAVRLEYIEWVVSLLEVFDERDEDLSDADCRGWRKRIFSGGS